MNKEKTQLFHAGLSHIESAALAGYGFTHGSLPIRYLGLPLMSRKLRMAEYAPLIDKNFLNSMPGLSCLYRLLEGSNLYQLSSLV